MKCNLCIQQQLPPFKFELISQISMIRGWEIETGLTKLNFQKHEESFHRTSTTLGTISEFQNFSSFDKS